MGFNFLINLSSYLDSIRMPYEIRKVKGRDAYYVVNVHTGKKHSTEPLSYEMAKRQLRALYYHTKE